MSRTFWQAHVEAWRDSGETQAAYCRRLGLSAVTFSGWKRRLEREQLAGVGQSSGQACASAELLAVALDDGGASDSGADTGICVEVGTDVRLRLSADFDAPSLTRAVVALRDAGC